MNTVANLNYDPTGVGQSTPCLVRTFPIQMNLYIQHGNDEFGYKATTNQIRFLNSIVFEKSEGGGVPTIAHIIVDSRLDDRFIRCQFGSAMMCRIMECLYLASTF